MRVTFLERKVTKRTLQRIVEKVAISGYEEEMRVTFLERKVTKRTLQGIVEKVAISGYEVVKISIKTLLLSCCKLVKKRLL